jgi:hypothetical protein
MKNYSLIYFEFLKKSQHPLVRIDLEISQPYMIEVNDKALKHTLKVLNQKGKLNYETDIFFKKMFQERQLIFDKTQIKIYSSVTHSNFIKINKNLMHPNLFIGEVDLLKLNSEQIKFYITPKGNLDFNLGKSYINTKIPLFIECSNQFLVDMDFNEKIRLIKDSPLSEQRKKEFIFQMERKRETLKLTQEMFEKSPIKNDLGKKIVSNLIENTKVTLENSLESSIISFSENSSEIIKKSSSNSDLKYFIEEEGKEQNSPTIKSPDSEKNLTPTKKKNTIGSVDNPIKS